MATEDSTEKITKRRVTCRSSSIVPGMKGPKGQPVTATTEKVDYVPDDERGLLAPYVEQMRLVWQDVEVSEEFDAGPGGYHGQTAVPEGQYLRNPDGSRGEFVPFQHPDAGRVFEATTPSKKKG